MGAGPRRVLRIAVWIGSLGVIAYHLALEASALRLEEPMGTWEVTYAAIAREWPSEYQPGHFVLGHDNYGPGYPAFCRPFLAVLHDPYLAGRLANLAALVAAAALVVAMARRSRASWTASVAAAAVVVGVCAGSYSIQVRPDFLLLLEMAVAWWVGLRAFGGEIGAVGAGLALGAAALAGYLTKPYGLFAWGSVVAALVVARRFRCAAVVAGVSGAVLAAGVAVYAAPNPYYLFETFQAHLSHTEPRFGWLLHQACDFSALACGPILLLALSAVQGLRPEQSSASDARYWTLVIGMAVAALALGMGWHTGAYLTYFMHLALIPLCVRAAIAFPGAAGEGDRTSAHLLFLLNAVLLVALAPAFPAPDPGWAELSADVLHQPGLVVLDAVMEPLSRQRGQAIMADTGIIRYALDEARSVAQPSAVVRAAQQEADAYEAGRIRMLGQDKPAAIYLDFVTQRRPGGRPGELAYSARNGLTWLSESLTRDYTPARIFHLHPYYYATNERRAGAGTWETLVIKFVRKGP